MEIVTPANAIITAVTGHNVMSYDISVNRWGGEDCSVRWLLARNITSCSCSSIISVPTSTKYAKIQMQPNVSSESATRSSRAPHSHQQLQHWLSLVLSDGSYPVHRCYIFIYNNY